MAFRCQQCGECCSYMGDIIGIEDRIDPVNFRIRFSVTGEERMVTLDPDKGDLFRSQDIGHIRPMACPFLRFRDPTPAARSITRVPISAASMPVFASSFSTVRATISAGYRMDRASFPR